MDAIEQRIVDNMGLVYKQLHKMHVINDGEAFSYAVEGLMCASKTYDESRNICFSTYATACIYNQLMMYFRVQRKEQSLVIVSFETPLQDSPDLTYGEVIQDDSTPDTVYLNKELYVVLWKAFDKILNETTNPVEVAVIKAWRDSEFLASQTAIAKLLDVSQPHVSRALSAFRYKLKKEMEDYLCES